MLGICVKSYLVSVYNTLGATTNIFHFYLLSLKKQRNVTTLDDGKLILWLAYQQPSTSFLAHSSFSG